VTSCRVVHSRWDFYGLDTIFPCLNVPSLEVWQRIRHVARLAVWFFGLYCIYWLARYIMWRAPLERAVLFSGLFLLCQRDTLVVPEEEKGDRLRLTSPLTRTDCLLVCLITFLNSRLASAVVWGFHQYLANAVGKLNSSCDLGGICVHVLKKWFTAVSRFLNRKHS